MGIGSCLTYPLILTSKVIASIILEFFPVGIRHFLHFFFMATPGNNRVHLLPLILTIKE